MKKLTRTETAQWLLERDRFCILTHRKPDGDTAGSAAALCLGLRSLGKQAWILKNEELTPRNAPLHQGLTKDTPEAEDILVAVDVASPGMLPKAFAPLADRVSLRIDHHGSATSFTELELVDPNAGACGDMIYDLFMELWVELDEKMATALYTAVATDTGCFRFANTTDHSFLVAAACAGAGAPVFRMNQELFETVSLGRLRLQGWMVENAVFLCGGRAVICAIPRKKEQELGLTEDDLDNISSFPRTIAGVCMAVTLRETPEGSKASVRAIPGYDAAAVCQRFGGGGHKGAAGASLALPLAEAEEAFKAALTEAMEGTL